MRYTTVLLCLMVMITTGCVLAQPTSLNRAIDQVYPALVRLDVVSVVPSEGRLAKRRSFGSGAIITKQGHVITNHHVAGKAIAITCRLSDGTLVPAKLVGTDPLVDIAVVQLAPRPKDVGRTWPVARFGDSNQVHVGDIVFAMGSPAALSQSVTRGIVSNAAMTMPDMVRRSGGMLLDGEDVGGLVRWIGHDAIIFGGNSGGPLVNEQGEIVGINEVGIGSLGGAIPGNLANSVAGALIDTGTVKRSWIGITYQARFQHQAHGVLVGGVVPDSPAQAAGLKAGDLITTYDGQSVDCSCQEDLPVFHALLLGRPVGQAVEVVYERQGDRFTTQVISQLRPRVFLDPVELKDWGMVARDITPMLALELKQTQVQGVFITSVRPGGPCATAKPELEPGDVIVALQDQPVASLDALSEQTSALLEASSARSTVAVTLVRKNDTYVSVIRIGSDEDKRNVGFARKAWLPVRTQVMTRDLIKAMDLPIRRGTRVIQVFKGRSAEEAGIQVGDILLKLDGETIAASNVGDTDALDQMVRQYPAGSKVPLALLRQGESLTVEVTLEQAEETTFQKARYESKLFEFSVRDVAFDDYVDLQLEPDQQGVYVERVQRAGWADLAGMTPGDLILSIDGEGTDTVQDVKAALKKAQDASKDSLVFFMQRGIYTQYVEVKTNPK
ncbi:MAG: PDZ domain-containing protein [Planctomycetes bacterium]|nr:PDZ domain-containing protein [Planctomycetota bacterium]